MCASLIAGHLSADVSEHGSYSTVQEDHLHQTLVIWTVSGTDRGLQCFRFVCGPFSVSWSVREHGSGSAARLLLLKEMGGGISISRNMDRARERANKLSDDEGGQNLVRKHCPSAALA